MFDFGAQAQASPVYVIKMDVGDRIGKTEVNVKIKRKRATGEELTPKYFAALVGAVVRNFAKSQHARSMPETTRDVERKVSFRAKHEIDEEADAVVLLDQAVEAIFLAVIDKLNGVSGDLTSIRPKYGFDEHLGEPGALVGVN